MPITVAQHKGTAVGHSARAQVKRKGKERKGKIRLCHLKRPCASRKGSLISKLARVSSKGPYACEKAINKKENNRLCQPQSRMHEGKDTGGAQWAAHCPGPLRIPSHHIDWCLREQAHPSLTSPLSSATPPSASPLPYVPRSSGHMSKLTPL
eukprot:1153245-Pelagomonas_calceolata.AAC.3